MTLVLLFADHSTSHLAYLTPPEQFMEPRLTGWWVESASHQKCAVQWCTRLETEKHKSLLQHTLLYLTAGGPAAQSHSYLSYLTQTIYSHTDSTESNQHCLISLFVSQTVEHSASACDVCSLRINSTTQSSYQKLMILLRFPLKDNYSSEHKLWNIFQFRKWEGNCCLIHAGKPGK